MFSPDSLDLNSMFIPDTKNIYVGILATNEHSIRMWHY